MKKLSKSC